MKKHNNSIVHWGILGAGHIAAKFALGLTSAPGAKLAAVASRDKEKAGRFGREHGVPACYGSYAQLAADPAVDVVYIATPHVLHKEHTLMCLEAGKAVLCEKPLAINAGEACEMAAAARKNKVFLMEAMWMRFLPGSIAVKQRITDDAIGEARMITADFCFQGRNDPQGRLFNRALGGGALLDVGIYPVSLAYMLWGGPEKIESAAHIGSTGVDEHSAALFSYADGRIATLTCSIATLASQEACVYGSKGSIKIHAPWWRGGKFSIFPRDKSEELVIPPLEGNGYNYEAIEVMNCMRENKLESDALPLQESIDVMKTLDAIRGRWGLRYPGE
jgi:predicted dehydrogenase